MKKFVILLFCMIAYHCNILADEKIEIELGVEIIDDTPTHPAPGKAPIRKPSIYQECHTLAFSTAHPEYIINIVQDGEVVYSSVIPAGVTEYELPAYVNGECVIQLITGRFCFWGYILL